MGFWMQDWFGFARNHYDRVLHFLFGLMIAYPLREMLLRYAKVSGWWAIVMAFALIISLGALYEIIEWAAMLVVDPDAGIAFLGTQGDVFDAEKDEVAAAAGGLLCLLVIQFLPHRRRRITP